jgi:hypothetical protein
MKADVNASNTRGDAGPFGEPARAASEYRRLGWSVIPIRRGAKLPLIAWEEYQHRCASEDEIAAWFRRWPNANVGIVTGSISRVVVLDIDLGHGGVESLARLEQANGSLPPTVEAATGGGGRHLYFQAPPTVLRTSAGLARGIDLRAEGGLAVAPPSLHPTGKKYAWRTGCDPIAMTPASLPLWLERLARDDGGGRGHPAQFWRALCRDGVEEGARNNTLASLAGHLLWHGVDPEVVTEMLLCWNRVRCRPPLDDEEVIRVTSSISRLHKRGEAT